MTTILASVGDETKIVDEEKRAWLQRVLIAFGADENIISNNTLGTKRHLTQLGLDVVSHFDGSIDIARFETAVVQTPDGEVPVESGRRLVAQWLPPKLVRMREKPKDFYMITLNEWALPFQMGEE